MSETNSSQSGNIAQQIKAWGKALGFQQIGITDTDLKHYHKHFFQFLKKNYQGSMHYLKKNVRKRLQPRTLLPGTIRIISARMDYFPPDTESFRILKDGSKAYISRYALGRDYHRLMRKRLDQLALKINNEITPLGYRAFCDSAPVLEKAIAQKAGLGFIGKHTNLINTKAGSWFFLGEIYTDLPLPLDAPMQTNHCGSCTACIDVCPTNAIMGPQQLDARRCISYLTIELRDAIPVELRALIGNRIYGCDDCQLVCPWNKFARFTHEKDFHPRHQLHVIDLLELFAWNEQTFLDKTAGSSIRRIGYESWQRNIAVALGNAPPAAEITAALERNKATASVMVQEHIDWALKQQLILRRNI
ncbi:MAG: tRNA epoxyqueuosine(34) reductase QueG [Gammaproteobacteria bacterium]|nr:tRNA epoxyqueuosine(34) reductase QueG [Gammaproteobacteria bacterium]